MNIININSSISINNRVISTVTEIVNNLDEKDMTIFLKHLSIKDLLDDTLILLVSEEQFIEYHRLNHSIDDKFQYSTLEEGCTSNYFTQFTYITNVSLAGEESEAIVLSPERINKCFNKDDEEDMSTVAIIYGLVKLNISKFDKSNIETFYNGIENLKDSYILLLLRVSNEALYNKLMHLVFSRKDDITETIKLVENEYNNWKDSAGIINNIELMRSLYKTLNEIYFSEDDDDSKDNSTIWNDSSIMSYDLQKNVLAELFYNYIDLTLITCDEEYEIKNIISKSQYYDKGLFLELFKLTTMFDIHNEFSDDYIKIGKIAYKNELNEYENNN